MSNTPETDAFFFRTDIEWNGEVEFARKLERERNNLQDQRDFAMSEIERLQYQLRHATTADEVRQALRGVVGLTEALANTQIELKKERDEEREQRDQIENQLELMTCKAAGWQNQATIEAKALVECWEKAERYRLEANAMMAQRDEAQRKVAELQAGLDDIEEYGTEEINAAVDLRHQLAAALVERDELKSEKEANYQCLLMLKRDLYKAREERDKAISVADRLIEYAHECLVKLESWGQGYQRYEDDMDSIREDIAAYDMMKEALK